MTSLRDLATPRTQAEADRFKSAALLEQKRRLRQIKKYHDLGNTKHLKKSVYHFLNRHENKWLAVEKVIPRTDASDLPSRLARVNNLASRLSVFTRCDETVDVRSKSKPNGTRRYYCAFGLENKARQYVVKSLLDELYHPNPLTFGVQGRGVDRMTDLIAEAFPEGFRWALSADIRNCFPSFNRQSVLECFYWLPPRCIDFVLMSANYDYALDHTLPIYPNTDTRPVVGVRLGIPQGSATSNLVAVAIINKLLNEANVGSIICPHYADDLLFMARKRSDLVAYARYVENIFGQEEAGPLQLQFSTIRRADWGFWFLKRHFRYRDAEYDLASPFSVKMRASVLENLEREVELAIAEEAPITSDRADRLRSRIHGVYGGYKGVNYLHIVRDDLLEAIRMAQSSRRSDRNRTTALTNSTKANLLPYITASIPPIRPRRDNDWHRLVGRC